MCGLADRNLHQPMPVDGIAERRTTLNEDTPRSSAFSASLRWNVRRSLYPRHPPMPFLTHVPPATIIPFALARPVTIA